MTDRRAIPPVSGFGPSGYPGTQDAADTTAVDEWLSELTAHGTPQRARWLGWRLRLLVAATLLGCVGLLLFIRLVAAVPVLPQTLSLDASGAMILKSKGEEPRSVTAAHGHDGEPLALEPMLSERSPRWTVNDAKRLRLEREQDALGAALAAGPITWTLRDGGTFVTQARPLGAGRLGVTFWLMSALALALYLVVVVIFMAKPSMKNTVYALAALPQAANLLFIAVESAVTVHMPPGFFHADHSWRSVFDAITSAAITHSAAMHPRALPWRRWLAPVVWGLSLVVALSLGAMHLPYAWWVVQGQLIGLGVLTLVQFEWSYRAEPHPLTLIFKRFGMVTWVVFVLLSAAVGSTSVLGIDGSVVEAIAAMIWVVFLASVLLATPFMSRSHPTIREFSMLAGVSTMATALDLLFVAVFSLGSFSALTLALFLSLMVYAGVRQWILNHMLQTNVLTTERMFEQLYRIARDVEAHPHRLPEHFSSLMKELYDPIEVLPVPRALTHSQVAGAGSTLMVPVPSSGTDAAPRTIALRYAHRGKRLFTPEDARLTDRVAEQLARAVAFDQAVERGRSEERVRIAQDLHDDIGARLLTLMYKAQNSEVEDYIRHTLHELKTLTRGLAAKDHRLSHAVGEWKADMSNRLNIARCELDWAFSYDDDVMLTVVQWSALTRILRELVNNVIAHGKASHVWLDAQLIDRHLRIRVADDGEGRAPQQWRPGLGVGGVRKRVKQLAGHVRWEENSPQGIVCVVDLRLDGVAG